MASERGTLLFGLFVAAYAAILLLNPSFMQVNYEALRETIFTDGDHLPLAVFPEMGRFYPMFGMEYRLLNLFSSRIVWLHVFVALQFLIVIWLVVRLMREAGANQAVAYVVTGAFALLPAFTNVWVGFPATERNLVFWLAILLLCFMAYQRQPRTIYLVWGIVGANIALYYKEPVFVMLAAFAGTHLLITMQSARPGKRLYDALLLLSSFLFIAIYIIVIVPYMGRTLYGDTNDQPLLVFAKILYSYAANDPVIIFLLLPLTAWRVYQIVIRRVAAHPIFDPMLAAGTAYLLVFLKLNMYSTNYMLPAYVFALPAVYYFFAQELLLKRPIWKLLAGIAVVLVVMNAIPLGLHIMALQKYSPVNSVLTMNALADDIKKQGPDRRPNIFLDGIYRELTQHPPTFTYDRDAYFNVGEAMKRRGLTVDQFDLKSDLPPRFPHLFPKGGDQAYAYSVFRSDEVWELSPGDYLVIMPHTTKNITDAYINRLMQEYDLLFRTQSMFAIPDISVRTYIKQLVKDTLPPGVVHDTNTQRTSDFYIFVKR